MVRKRRALVIGGSMSGLLAGIMLMWRGWAVDIYERVASELSGPRLHLTFPALSPAELLVQVAEDLGSPAEALSSTHAALRQIRGRLAALAAVRLTFLARRVRPPAVERVGASPDQEGEQQHPVQPVRFPFVAELGKADGHPLVAGRGLGAVGAQQVVPPRQVEAEGTIGFAGVDGMVDAVHLRGDHHQPQHTVQPAGKADVAVAEHGRGVEENLEDQHGQR